jgi:hypothetical protein
VKMDSLSSADSVPLDFAVLCPTYNLDREKTSQADAGNPVKFVQNYRKRRPQKPLNSVAGGCTDVLWEVEARRPLNSLQSGWLHCETSCRTI